MSMTKQEIFDKVATHLLTQNKKALGADPAAAEVGVLVCRYRGDNNTMCAVGCLIADAAYSPKLENLKASDSRVTMALEASGLEVTEDIDKLLMSLQTVHDNTSVPQWKHDLAFVARLDGLNSIVLEKF